MSFKEPSIFKSPEITPATFFAHVQESAIFAILLNDFF